MLDTTWLKPQNFFAHFDGAAKKRKNVTSWTDKNTMQI